VHCWVYGGQGAGDEDQVASWRDAAATAVRGLGRHDEDFAWEAIIVPHPRNLVTRTSPIARRATLGPVSLTPGGTRCANSSWLSHAWNILDSDTQLADAMSAVYEAMSLETDHVATGKAAAVRSRSRTSSDRTASNITAPPNVCHRAAHLRHGLSHQRLAAVACVFAVGAVHHPTMARLQLQRGICEAERQHGALHDRARLIVAERTVVSVPLLEVRAERHPSADVQRAELLVCCHP
jgi:hypothetical protein